MTIVLPRSSTDRLAGLDAPQRDWVANCWQLLSDERLQQLAMAVTDIASPTGEERPLAEELARQLRAAGVDGRVQPIDNLQANAWGCIAGSDRGPSLMLYAPIDTFTVGTEEEDLPSIGPELRADMRPHAIVDGPFVTGLGAGNPKGHAACILAAVEAIAAARIPLAGDLFVGFGAGGMPSNARTSDHRERDHIGQGIGASFLLEQGVCPDFAVIAKPGWAASWEEVGLAWFDVWVSGTHTYVGSRHRLPYVNAIAQAGVVVDELEAWFERYAGTHTSGYVAPQGVVSSIEGGWRRLAASTPGRVRIRCDLRVSPRDTPQAVRREFGAFVDGMRDRHVGLDVDWEMVLAIPGSCTDERSWVVRSSVAAWEAAEGRAHEAARETSGATDANILRHRGVPTVRIGMPKVTGAPFAVDFARGMNTVDVREMRRLTEHLIRVAIDTCTRTLSDVGIENAP